MPGPLRAVTGATLANKRRLYQARLFELSAIETVTELLFYEALPSIFDGIRTAVSYSLVLVVAVEMFVGLGERGLGRGIYEYQSTYRIPETYAAIIIAGVIGIVLNGSFYCSRAVGRHMIARGGGGSIVSVLANYAWTGSAGTIHSASAKAGVMAMTQTLAVEWAPHRIRVNAIAPGPIESPGAARQLWSSDAAVKTITDSVPLGRWGRTDEIGDAVSFLVSPHAAYITGEVLTVDGGQWLNRGTYNFLSLPQ